MLQGLIRNIKFMLRGFLHQGNRSVVSGYEFVEDSEEHWTGEKDLWGQQWRFMG